MPPFGIVAQSTYFTIVTPIVGGIIVAFITTSGTILVSRGNRRAAALSASEAAESERKAKEFFELVQAKDDLIEELRRSNTRLERRVVKLEDEVNNLKGTIERRPHR